MLYYPSHVLARFACVKRIAIEFIKYDLGNIAMLVSYPALVIVYVLWKFGKCTQAFSLLSFCFRQGWPETSRFASSFLSKNMHIKGHNFSPCMSEVVTRDIDAALPLKKTAKFFDDPSLLFEGVAIILKSYSNDEKGVLLIKYSYYFPLMFKLFDMLEVQQRYHIVLEPSWSGYCEASILAYAGTLSSVFVLSPEKRDYDFLNALPSNLIPVNVGANNWVDHRVFFDGTCDEKEFDLVMVAGWADYKRHFHFLKAIQELKTKGEIVKIALVGYPIERDIGYIEEIVNSFELNDHVTIFERIPPSDVSKVMRHSRINIIWSRFEGINRVIIEGMFCGVPCILREGFNYGEHYHYINEMTGCFANDNNLPSVIMGMLNHIEDFSPREYVMENMSCHVGRNKLNDAIKEEVLARGSYWSEDIVCKVNELHGMKYYDSNVRGEFEADYYYLTSKIKEGRLLT